MATTPADSTAAPQRAALRQQLLTARKDWASGPDAHAAQKKLQERLLTVLSQLEPGCLGVFWPVQGEFNPMDVALSAQQQWHCRLALPFARRDPVSMDFRLWDGASPALKDECGIPTADGAVVVPEVVLLPCVGFSPQGWRLGYGGGYFDRYLAAHPEVTAIGVSWSIGQLQENVINPQPHDRPLIAVITESNIWSE